MRFGQHDQLDQPVAQTKTLRSETTTVGSLLRLLIRLNRFFHLGKNRNRSNRFFAIYCDLLRFFAIF